MSLATRGSIVGSVSAFEVPPPMPLCDNFFEDLGRRNIYKIYAPVENPYDLPSSPIVPDTPTALAEAVRIACAHVNGVREEAAGRGLSMAICSFDEQFSKVGTNPFDPNATAWLLTFTSHVLCAVSEHRRLGPRFRITV